MMNDLVNKFFFPLSVISQPTIPLLSNPFGFNSQGKVIASRDRKTFTGNPH